MIVQRGFEEAAAYRSGFVSIGNFDGVHLGHQRMISTLVRRAQQATRPSVVLTFDPHPLELLAPEKAPPRLCSPQRKAELLAECGVDCLIVYPTDAGLLNLSPREFFDRVLIEEVQTGGLVEGPNFCFGKDRAGDVTTLRKFCDEAGVQLDVVEAVSVRGRLVSSSEIRKLIREGSMAEAAVMLGRSYRITGEVQRGASRGAGLGFPTANLSECGVMLPCAGVYAALASVRGREYGAAVHIGPNPTFADPRQKTEVHLIDYVGGDLYGETISVDFLDRVRDTMEFGSAAALTEQLSCDVAEARRIIQAVGSNPDRTTDTP
jgi:riboflavin kinase/FMN adenylyltransferase